MAYASVAQLVEALVLGTNCCRFDSYLMYDIKVALQVIETDSRRGQLEDNEH